MIIYDMVALNVEHTFKIADLFVRDFLTASTKDLKSTVLYLIGDLGAGKTTFMRGMLKSFGFHKAVKSPTYTIIETYHELVVPIYHFDLYRLNHPKELELIGIRDYLQEQAICCFEWPNKGTGFIPDPDFTVNLAITREDQRKIVIDKA